MKPWIVKSIIVSVLAALAFFLISPLFDQDEEDFVERVVAVETLTVSESAFEESYRSVAFISPKTITQAAFQNVGTITQINVKEGDRVVVNQVLARIDDEQSRLQLQNSKEAYANAQFNLQSAQSNAETEKRLYDEAVAADEARLNELRVEQLSAKQRRDDALSTYETNLETLGQNSPTTQASLVAYNQAELEYQIATTQYETALENGESNDVLIARSRYNAAQSNVNANQTQVNIARNNVTQAENNLENTTLRASVNGTVVRVVGNVNELATPLAPVVVIASDDLKAIFGVPFQWLPSLYLNQPIKVFNSTNSIDAVITSIAPLPDQTSRTYEIGVDLAAQSFAIGSSVSIEIALNEISGVWLPITSIMNDGQPYVYVVEDGRAIKRRIALIGFNNTDVRVEGLSANEVVIINGVKSLRSGTAVKVVNQP
jgi:RND family efflux transporter MFP subunit